MNVDLAKASVVLRRAAELIEQRAKTRWDGCVDRDGNGFSCIDIVDDNGYETETIDHGDGRFELRPKSARKPVNAEATKLYWATCRPGTTHQIVGDVAIVLDADFA